jgi:uncharacterized protein YciI
MKLALGIVICVIACGSPQAAKPVAPAAKFEMKSYFLVLLRRGPAWTADETPESKKLSEGHMANIKAMAASGKLLLAGPTDADASDPTTIAGIFIFDVKERAEVEALLTHDPAIAAQRLVPEILPWYGPAGITYPGKQ